MCHRDVNRLIALFDSLRRVRPEPSASEHDIAFYNGTLHGVKLSIQQVPDTDEKAA